jgi:hypothetical protein
MKIFTEQLLCTSYYIYIFSDNNWSVAIIITEVVNFDCQLDWIEKCLGKE